MPADLTYKLGEFVTITVTFQGCDVNSPGSFENRADLLRAVARAIRVAERLANKRGLSFKKTTPASDAGGR